MFVPKHLYHTSKNPFNMYGFHYETLAHWFAVQNAASKGQPFMHFFDMNTEELPKIHYIPLHIINEGLEAMVAQNNITEKVHSYIYAISDPILGVGSTPIRIEYGDKHDGRNLYGKAIERVLKRRKTSK
jgi:hypothetical protein